MNFKECLRNWNYGEDSRGCEIMAHTRRLIIYIVISSTARTKASTARNLLAKEIIYSSLFLREREPSCGGADGAERRLTRFRNFVVPNKVSHTDVSGSYVYIQMMQGPRLGKRLKV